MYAEPAAHSAHTPSLELAAIARARLLLMAGALALVIVNRLLQTDVTFFGDACLIALAALFLLGMRVGLPGRWATHQRPMRLILLALDAAIATGVIYLTGASASPFIPLYLPVVMLAAILAGRAPKRS
ncbi:MAG: hypothetical protein QY326_03525 [Bdellovibrionota bacterium]|nr:MAG: hypothetical protein QY326_03525 [Bdellovibrionota bacterium]